jgi:hypothetical protein
VRETIAVSFGTVGNPKVERRKPDCPEVLGLGDLQPAGAPTFF